MRCRSWLVVPVALAAGVLSYGARADDPPASASASASETPPPPKSLRKVRPEPTVVEMVNLGGDRDPQGFAMGVQFGPSLLYTRGSAPQFAVDTALVGEFGLGPGGNRVPWTLEPFLAFAVPYNVVAENGGHPNRFTEIGVRIVYRFDGGVLDGRWLSLGGGVVWTSRRPSSGFFDPSGACRRDNLAQANALGLDCSHDDNISPGALVDVGVGVIEWKVRRARWGIGARVPVQISSTPGFGAIGFFYAQVGAAL
jgi:hypothetical protein